MTRGADLSTITVASEGLRGSLFGHALASSGLFSAAFDSSFLVGSAQSQMPWPLPSPASPASAALGSSGVSSSGFGGTGLAILALLFSLLAMSGRLLRSSCEFLRPNSALLLVAERPG